MVRWYLYAVSNIKLTFDSIKKLSNTEAELKIDVAYVQKGVIQMRQNIVEDYSK